MTKQINKCSFCGRSEREVEMLLTGATGFICNDCVERAHEMIEEILKKNKTVNSGLGFTKEDLPRPQEIKKFLDQYVIGILQQSFIMIEYRNRQIAFCRILSDHILI